MTTLFNDIKYAIRQLRNSLGFTFATVLILALGIGGVTAMFSTFYTVLLKPLPYSEPEQLVLARTTFSGRINSWSAALDYFDYQEKNRSFAALESYFCNPQEVTVTTAQGAEREEVSIVSPGLIPTLGVKMFLGQSFASVEDNNEASSEVIVSHAYWQRKLGAQADVIGKPLVIGGDPLTIVGVLPSDFHFIQDVDLWIPMPPRALTREPRRFANWHILGRLKPRVSLAEAQSDVDVIAAQLALAYPDSNSKKGMLLTPLQRAYAEGHSGRYAMLGISAGVILLIACANAAGLLLARGAGRQGELAVRAAMGASRWRLMHPLLAEALLLAGMGGIAGTFLAYSLQDLLLRMMPVETLLLGGIGISGPMLLFVLAVTLLTGLSFGLLPAWRAQKTDVVQDLRSSGRGMMRHGLRLRGGLVVAQVVLSFLLLVVAGLLLRSFTWLQKSDPGFDSQNLLTVEVPLPRQDYSARQRPAFFAKLLDDVKSLPGVVDATANSQLPLRNPYNNIDIHAANNPPDDPVNRLTGNQRVVLPGYFKAIGIPLLAGRDLRETDTRDSGRVVIISQKLSEQLFQGTSPLGQHVIINRDTENPWQIVGVTGDVKENNLFQQANELGTFYRVYGQQSPRTMRLAIRTAGPPLAIVPALQNLLQKTDPRIPLSGPRTMEQIMANNTISYRAIAVYLTTFSLLALTLAAIGIYGLLAYLVTQRTRDIGIRMALGAEPGTILTTVMSSGIKLVGIGLGIGLLGALALSRLLSSMLFGVKPTDIPTFISVAVILGIVATIACTLPAWRAAKIDPMEALRYE
ncbi:ABC transporter permease [Planctomycetota bacterium]